MSTIVIHTPTLTDAQLSRLTDTFGTAPVAQANHFRLTSTMPKDALTDACHSLSQAWQLDLNLLPESFDAQAVRLLISDMDSTLIGIECVDEIADMLGIKPQVAAITEAAMRGELKFEESLTERVALLEGLETQALDRVMQERLFLNPGAEAWIDGLKARNIAFALVSGGFTYFTDRLKDRLKLDHTQANVLEVMDDRLTGRVKGAIVGAEAKATFLTSLCAQYQIDCRQTIAIGDGANDLKMMHAAGLSIAYHAKPAVQAQADVSLNYGGLDKVLDFLA
ncbi:phosphoserine phosphatase SerB [Thiomicrospira sp. WB1]|uniref:phosphoserine phosphatase SerB n=1 Tax=Thiomicrospira sp. WB1 TaxID=1685380 RepID=UPI0007479E25|nr:phosphoserine phosphatase SerB [Thiomicrospira sp. WB1]KUJ71560.1 phosphoserine phosphatase [Thiomicrospira sp. WB1]